MMNQNNVSNTRIVYQCNNCTIKYVNLPEICNKCYQKDGFTKRHMYCLDKILSYGFFCNIIISKRRGGKTYAGAEFCIKEWKSSGIKFIWIRRYKTELKKSLEAFEKLGYLFDKTGVYIEKEIINDKKKKDKQKIYIGLTITLSTATRIKGGEFFNFKNIVIDEYGDEVGFSFKKEFMLIASIITSVFDEKNNCRLLVLSNNTNRFLPLFQHAVVKWDQEWTFNWKKDIVIHVWNTQDFKPIGSAAKFLESTEYYEFAFQNKPMDYDIDLIETYKLEFAIPEFCFQVLGIKERLTIMHINDIYVVTYCEKCNHEFWVIDQVNTIKFLKRVSTEYQEKILAWYLEKKLKYTTPEIKENMMTWILRHINSF